MSYPNHNNHGRSSRQGPPSVDSHSGSLYAEQGTISLLPLTVTFPTPFDPPGLSLRFTSTHPNSTFTSLDTVPNHYQNPYPRSQGGSSYTNQVLHYGQQNVRVSLEDWDILPP